MRARPLSLRQALGEGAWASRSADLEVIGAVVPLEQLTSLTALMAGGIGEEASAALDAALAEAMKQ